MAEVFANLARKLELLVEFGPYGSLEDIAARFGVAPKTVIWWRDGDRGRDPGRVPTRHVKKMVALFAEALPGSLSPEDVRALALGDIRKFERAMREGSPVSLTELIRQEGHTGTAVLRRAPGLSLVESDDDLIDLPEVRLEERFQIEFRIGVAGNLLLLQHAQQTWGVVAFADGAPTARFPAGTLVAPGAHEGRPIFIRETADTGLHRFILFNGPEPYPVSILHSAAVQKSLDLSALNDLAAHYAALPRHLREVHVFHLRVAAR